MRISNQMIQQRLTRELSGRLESLQGAQLEATSGRRVRTVSDDPVDASSIMRIESQLGDIDQFRRNGTAATTRLSAEDVVLTTVQELIKRAKELAMSAESQPPTDPLRQAAFKEVGMIRDQIISLGNTRVGNEYIFGGGRTTSPPFLSNGSYVGDTSVRQAGIDEGVMVDTNHTGDQVLSGAIVALANVSTELQTGTQTTIETAVSTLTAAQDQALSAQAEVGSRLREIKDTGDNLAQRASNLLDRRGALRDADPAESLLKVTTAQSALERAYAVVGKILSHSLTDYLR